QLKQGSPSLEAANVACTFERLTVSGVRAWEGLPGFSLWYPFPPANHTPAVHAGELPATPWTGKEHLVGDQSCFWLGMRTAAPGIWWGWDVSRGREETAGSSWHRKGFYGFACQLPPTPPPPGIMLRVSGGPPPFPASAPRGEAVSLGCHFAPSALAQASRGQQVPLVPCCQHRPQSHRSPALCREGRRALERALWGPVIDLPLDTRYSARTSQVETAEPSSVSSGQSPCLAGLQKGRQSQGSVELQFHGWTDPSTFLPSAVQLTESRRLRCLASAPGAPPRDGLLPGGLGLICCLKFPRSDHALEFSVWYMRSRLNHDLLCLLNPDGESKVVKIRREFCQADFHLWL
ncbi:hypothetical protein E2320_013170, partial [Naja naja]